MKTMKKPYICGNWKMYKTAQEAKEFSAAFLGEDLPNGVRVGIFAPYLQLAALTEAFLGTDVIVGAQNVFYEDEGAYTGEVAPKMLSAAGVTACIVGHSERRQLFHETDADVNRKLKALFRWNIAPILCVGETLEERNKGDAKAVVSRQLRADLEGISEEDAKGLTVAYEPIWAIGTGLTASADDANEMCAVIRNELASLYDAETADLITIQYGGSVKPSNVAELMRKPEIDGVLVGGASLDAKAFSAIVRFDEFE